MTKPNGEKQRPARHGVPWSDNELDLLDRAIRSGWTWPEIAERFERKQEAVRSRAMRQGFELYYQRPVDLSDSGPVVATATGDEGRTR